MSAEKVKEVVDQAMDNGLSITINLGHWYLEQGGSLSEFVKALERVEAKRKEHRKELLK